MGWGAKLQRLGASEFADLVGNPIVFQRASGTMTATLTLQGETYFSGDRVADMHLDEPALREFIGDYRSDELEATYKVSLVKGALALQIGENPPVNLKPVGPNEFQASDIGTVVFDGNGDKHVLGLTLFSQPARGILFQKRN